MPQHIDLTPTWGEVGNLYRTLINHGAPKDSIKEMQKELARAFAMAQALKEIYYDIPDYIQVVAEEIIERELAKQGFGAEKKPEPYDPIAALDKLTIRKAPFTLEVTDHQTGWRPLRIRNQTDLILAVANNTAVRFFNEQGHEVVYTWQRPTERSLLMEESHIRVECKEKGQVYHFTFKEMAEKFGFKEG